MKKMLTFSDVIISPKFSLIESRSQVNLGSSLHFLEMKLPVIAANMDTITGVEMANAMLHFGAQACLHRFGSIEDTVKLFCQAKLGSGWGPMVSIGLGEHEILRATTLKEVGAHTYVIDVAHGAQISVVNQVKALREAIGEYGNIVVGNFASADSLAEFRAALGLNHRIDAVKVGIGPGSACTTRIKTGVGVPQLSAVMEIADLLKGSGIKVIADGGLKTPGDIAKALGAGAHMVMVGGMLAGTDESPGDKVWKSRTGEYLTKEVVYPSMMMGEEQIIDMRQDPDLPAYKKYRGSASQESYEAQGKKASHRTAEGESFYVPAKGPVADILADIEGGLRSAFTYVGASTLEQFHAKVEFVQITAAGYIEGTPHGKS